MNSVGYKRYFDQVYGGWFGKCLGGAAGAPVEGIKKVIDIQDFGEIIDPDVPNDDLDIQLLWLEVLEKYGMNIDSSLLADAWLSKCWYPFSEYGYFMKNYRRGIKPPYSGKFNNPFFKEGMGCAIRSEIWGFVFPGNPDLAIHYAYKDATLDHSDNAVLAEQFLAAIESMVFYEKDLMKLIDLGLRYVDIDSKLYRCIQQVVLSHERDSDDWKRARKSVIKNFGHSDFTNVVQNVGFIVISLLYGKGDLAKTVNIAMQCGYDTDCTCATAGAILGSIIGYDAIEEVLKNYIQDYFVIGIDVQRRSNSIRDLAEDTCRVGVSILELLGEQQVIADAIKTYQWKPETNQLACAINVEYGEEPAIGANDSKNILLSLHNKSEIPVKGRVSIENLPDGWYVEIPTDKVCLLPHQEKKLHCTVSTQKELKKLNQTNILSVRLKNEKEELLAESSFGLSGAQIWYAYGPYTEQLNKKKNPNHPSPHRSENSVLPTPECMVNNVVFLDKPYEDEKTFQFLNGCPDVIINAYEDLIPIEQNFSAEGQSCFYLMQEFESDKDEEIWLVIGNNDGFKLWVNNEEITEKDEIRLWTPYNNSEIVKIRKGVNQIVLKLLRRTKSLDFSIAMRKYEGGHWHRKEWITNLSMLTKHWSK